MILRTWRGAVLREDAERYLEHQADTGIADYRRTPGDDELLAEKDLHVDHYEVVSADLDVAALQAPT